MAEKILIVHGYSDGSTSFTGLGDFLVAQGQYTKENVFYLDYSSMDDQATFRDFADKLEADHRMRLGNERVDVACHSTGSLVVRAWLALHAQRTRRRRLNPEPPCPVERLLCFAPANFGSDLAGLGQSFLAKFRTTFFNSHSRKKEDFLESGKAVLQGLEPASPFQWELSEYDLHGADTYFSPTRPPNQRCYPFVFAAGEAYRGVEATLVKQRGMLGTDGTVRISGTSLNTRGCSLDFREEGAVLGWWKNYKHDQIPFAVFAGFNHGSIIEPTHQGFEDPNGPGTLAIEVLREKNLTPDSYQAMAKRFDEVSLANLVRLPPDRQAPYQQFFFKVRDDVDMIVEDFFIDFHVANRDGSTHEDLTLFFEEHFAKQITRHSTTGSHRVFLMNCGQLDEFHRGLRAADAVLMLEVTGASPLPDVRYEKKRYAAFDPQRALEPGEPALLFPNTTTMVDVILNRIQTDNLLVVKDGKLDVVSQVAVSEAQEPTGRATLVPH